MEGGKSVRFNVSPTEDCPVSNSPIMPPNILISQSTQSTDSTDSTNLSGILTSHKRSNTVQPRRTQQTGIKICLRIILNIVYLHIILIVSVSLAMILQIYIHQVSMNSETLCVSYLFEPMIMKIWRVMRMKGTKCQMSYLRQLREEKS